MVSKDLKVIAVDGMKASALLCSCKSLFISSNALPRHPLVCGSRQRE